MVLKSAFPGLVIDQYKLAPLLKSYGYKYTKAKRELRTSHRNKLLNQILWTKQLIYYQRIRSFPVYYIGKQTQF